MPPTTLAALLAGLASALLLVAGLLALGRRRVAAGLAGALLGLLLLALAGFFAALGLAAQGYRALTHEEVAATVRVRPLGAQSFVADVVLADGSRQRFQLAGDELYVDARILKWHPWVNLLGLHTAYELDRIGGRYLRLEDERDRPRTVHSLVDGERLLDAFGLRRRHAWLAPLVDAEYGSATFTRADGAAVYEVRVSTSGLLVRDASQPE